MPTSPRPTLSPLWEAAQNTHLAYSGSTVPRCGGLMWSPEPTDMELSLPARLQAEEKETE